MGKSLHLHLSTSCGLVESARRDSNPLPQRSTNHLGRGIERRTPASTKADEATGDQGRKSFQPDQTTPGEADLDSWTERADHSASPEVGGISSLATRLLIGRLRHAIRWPSLIGQAHGRQGNSHPSGWSPDLSRL